MKIIIITKQNTIKIVNGKMQNGKLDYNGMTYLFQSDKLYKFNYLFGFKTVYTHIYREDNPMPISLEPDYVYNNQGNEFKYLLNTKTLSDWLGSPDMNFPMQILFLVIGAVLGAVIGYIH